MKYLLSFTTFLMITVSVCAAGSEGIIVFTQKGCSRCEFTVNYFKQNNIKYTECPTEIESNNSRMWSFIEESGNPEVENITMPVIVNSGEVYFSIDDLENFVKRFGGKK